AICCNAGVRSWPISTFATVQDDGARLCLKLRDERTRSGHRYSVANDSSRNAGRNLSAAIWIAQLRFEYVEKEVRQLVIFESEVDTCHKENDSRPENHPFQGAVFVAIYISSEGANNHAGSQDTNDIILLKSSQEEEDKPDTHLGRPHPLQPVDHVRPFQLLQHEVTLWRIVIFDQSMTNRYV
ncbi:MAG: hypothetical protein ACLQFI_09520, partial [Methylocella sp.]